jgi:predicted  nucleic acid-binding Zn-ribbon protein
MVPLFPLFFQSDQNGGSLKEELRRILPQVEEMRKRKSDRRNQFLEVQGQIQEISNEIYGSSEYMSSKMVVDDSDLSLRKLEELHRKLHELQKEKVELFYYFFSFYSIPISSNFAAYYLNAQCSLLSGT